MEVFYVLGTEVFPGKRIVDKHYDFFRDHRVGSDSRWFSLCPHGTELRGGLGSKKNILKCQECGQIHLTWVSLESRTLFLPETGPTNGRYRPLGSLVLFHEEGQPVPGKYLIGLPSNQVDGAIVLWRIISPASSQFVMSNLGQTLYQSLGYYSHAGGNFYVLEMLALIGRERGMTVSTSDYRSVLIWNGKGVDVSTTQRMPRTVES